MKIARAIAESFRRQPRIIRILFWVHVGALMIAVSAVAIDRLAFYLAERLEEISSKTKDSYP